MNATESYPDLSSGMAAAEREAAALVRSSTKDTLGVRTLHFYTRGDGKRDSVRLKQRCSGKKPLKSSSHYQGCLFISFM